LQSIALWWEKKVGIAKRLKPDMWWESLIKK